SPDSSVAYVTVQWHQVAAGYPDELYRLDTRTWELTPMRTDLGLYPRHLVIDAAGEFLYASLTGEGKVIKIEAATGKTVGTVSTGAAPRTIVLAPDGRSLYVVNYDARTLVKVDTGSMRVVQRLPTFTHPVGVTYEPTTNTVWVACYSGALQLFHEGP
ncbi:MAG: YncE family protein, partial [Chloroflexota bacterium]